MIIKYIIKSVSIIIWILIFFIIGIIFNALLGLIAISAATFLNIALKENAIWVKMVAYSWLFLPLITGGIAFILCLLGKLPGTKISPSRINSFQNTKKNRIKKTKGEQDVK